MYDTDVEKTMEGLTDVKKTLAFNITDQNLFRISIAEECMGKQTGFSYVDVPKDDVLLLQELLPQAVDLMLKNAKETSTPVSG